jgi:hypothetical protein
VTSVSKHEHYATFDSRRECGHLRYAVCATFSEKCLDDNSCELRLFHVAYEKYFAELLPRNVSTLQIDALLSFGCHGT